MTRRNDLPIIMSHATRTGIIAYPNHYMGGRDVIIVGLNKDVPSGELFDVDDIDWVKATLHFADIESLRVTVKCLTQELKKWEECETDE